MQMLNEILTSLSLLKISRSGFEAGGPNVPSNIFPWSIIGDDSTILVSTDRTSCFGLEGVARDKLVFGMLKHGHVSFQILT